MELVARKIKNPSPEFFKALATALAAYQAGRRIDTTSMPSNVRGNLKSAWNAALKLNEKLNRLDANSRALLSEIEKGGVLALREHLSVIVFALGDAHGLAQEHQNSGRTRDIAKLILAATVRDTIKTHLRVTATTTKDGLFEAVLTIVLEIAHAGKKVKSVHDLVQKALKVRIVKKYKKDGNSKLLILTEYVLPDA